MGTAYLSFLKLPAENSRWTGGKSGKAQRDDLALVAIDISDSKHRAVRGAAEPGDLPGALAEQPERSQSQESANQRPGQNVAEKVHAKNHAGSRNRQSAEHQSRHQLRIEEAHRRGD